MKFTEAKLEQAIIQLLTSRYQDQYITDYEIGLIIHRIKTLPASDLYDSRKAIMKNIATL